MSVCRATQKEPDKNKNNKTLYTKGLFFFYATTIIVVTLIPLSDMGLPALNKMWFLGLRVDIWLHILFFFPLLPLLQLNVNKKNIWILITLGLLVATVAEGIHLILPYRSFDIGDLGGNVAGVLAGALFLPLMNKY